MIFNGKYGFNFLVVVKKNSEKCTKEMFDVAPKNVLGILYVNCRHLRLVLNSMRLFH